MLDVKKVLTKILAYMGKSDRFTITPSAGQNYSNYGSSYYEATGRTVHIHLGLSGLTPQTTAYVYTMPATLRPQTLIAAAGTGGESMQAYSWTRISTDGKVYVNSVDHYACVDIYYLI